MKHALKKYGLTYSLLVLASILIVSFAFDGWKHEGRPTFRLVTIEGDPTAVPTEALTITGQYVYTDALYDRLEVDVNGSNFKERETILNDELSPWYGGDPEMKQLVAEHRGFFRGNLELGSYYYDGELLAAVNIDEIQFERVLSVSVLDKKNDQATHFSIPSPIGEGKNSWYVFDVQRADKGKLVVLVSDNDENGARVVQLLIDIESRKLESRSSIMEQEAKGVYDGIYLESSWTGVSPQQYYLLKAVKKSDKPIESEVAQAMQEDYDYFSYDIKSGAIRPIQSDALSNQASLVEVNGNRLKYAISDGAEIDYREFDMKSGQQIGEPFQIDASKWGAVNAYATSVNDAFISIDYDHAGNANKTGVAVVDRKTNQTIYRGEVQEVDQHFGSNDRFYITTGIKLKK